MSTILLQLEAALADARAALERASEKLHDAGVQHALAKAEHDAAADNVRRVEGALNSMHGVSSPAPAGPAGATVSAAIPEPPAPTKKRREPPSGPICNGCGEQGKIEKISAQLAACSACGAQYPQ